MVLVIPMESLAVYGIIQHLLNKFHSAFLLKWSKLDIPYVVGNFRGRKSLQISQILQPPS